MIDRTTISCAAIFPDQIGDSSQQQYILVQSDWMFAETKFSSCLFKRALICPNQFSDITSEKKF